MIENENGKIISRIKEQTKMLCEFTQDFFIHQIIEHSTRKSNLLDLVFCNEDDLFTNQTVIENVLMSDHKIVILESNISLNSKKESESKENIYKTTIPSYNLLLAEESEWNVLNEKLFDINWKEHSDMNDIDEYTEFLIENCEINTVEVMKNRGPSKCSNDANGSSYSSNNLIPKNIRKLFKRKCKISKQIRNTHSVDRCDSLRKEILKIDIELKNSYEKRNKTSGSRHYGPAPSLPYGIHLDVLMS